MFVVGFARIPALVPRKGTLASSTTYTFPDFGRLRVENNIQLLPGRIGFHSRSLGPGFPLFGKGLGLVGILGC
jgi:hypothetical protein